MTLTFDQSTWTQPRDVVVVGVDDAAPDGDVFYTIITTVSHADDPADWGIDPDDVQVINLDNDTGGR
jgi:hypothetical protein